MAKRQTPSEAATVASPAPGPTPGSNSVPFLFSEKSLPFLIALGALLLRLWGIGWALPNATRAFSYHPDESMVVGHSLAVNPILLLLDPEFYNYGSLSLLLNGLFIHLGEWVGLVGAGPMPGIPSASALLVARLLTAFLGAGTCLFIYHTGRLLYGRTAGTFAALVYALTPLAVQHAHFATVDVPATFWISGTLYFAVRHLSEERGPRDLLWCGLWAGLAAATKYNAGLVLLAGLVAWLLGKPRAVSGIASVIGMAAVGFLVGCPGVLLNFKMFARDFASEAVHVRQGHGDVFVNTPPGFIYHFGVNLGWGLGLPLVIAALVGIGFALVRRRPGDLALLAFFVAYYGLISLPTIQVKFARYTIPLLPVLALYIGALFSEWRGATRIQQIANAALIAALAFGLFLTVGFNNAMTGPDTRDQAAAAIRSSGVSSVGFATGPWFYSPPLNPFLGHPIPPQARQSALENQSLRLIAAVQDKDPLKPVEWSVDLLKSSAPQAVVLSEFEYADSLRIHKPEAVQYRDALKADYPNRQVFAAPITVFGLPITTLVERDGLPVQRLPHDMMYTNPTTVLFSK